MEKNEQLFIRACKEVKPFNRVIRTYRKLYLYNGDHYNFSDIAFLLGSICDKYTPIKSAELCVKLDPNNFRNTYRKDKKDYWRIVCETFIFQIRMTTAKKLIKKGFIKSSRWRKKEEEYYG